MVQKVQRTVEVPQIEFVEQHVHVAGQKHMHVPMIHTVEKIVDVPQIKQIDVPQIHTVEKIVEVPMVQVVDRVIEVPIQGQTLPGQQVHMNVPAEPVHQRAPEEVHQVHEIGAHLPAEQGQTVHVATLPTQHGGVMPMVTAQAIPVAAPTQPLDA